MRIPATVLAAVVAVLAGLALVVAGARSDTPRFETRSTPSARPLPTRVVLPTVPAEPSPTSLPAPHNRVFVGFSYVQVALVALFVLVFLVLVFPALRRPTRARRGRSRRGEPDVEGAEVESGRQVLAEAVGGGLRDVERGEPRDAVVACWLRLEDAAALAGTARRPAETAGELTARVLAAHRVAPDTLRRLADLYREARYSRHPLDERARDEARAALERIRAELGVRGGEPVGPA